MSEVADPDVQAIVAAARDVQAHFEQEGHGPSAEENCCMCWAVGRLREATDAYARLTHAQEAVEEPT